MMIEPVFHHDVRFGWRDPAIHKHQSQLQLISILKIVLDHRSPAFLDGLGHFRISVSRQIYKVQSFIDEKKVDRLSPARRRARASQPMSLGQRIQQTGFANIRSATKCDFRSLISGKFSRSCCTLDESGGANFHDWQSRGRNLASLYRR
jgi:hypothetical protein